MTVNVGKFELEISKKIAATTDSKELLMLTTALKQIKSGTVDYVANYASLPTASCYRGKMFFVDSECLVYWSTGSKWISIKSSNAATTLWTWGYNGFGQLGTSNTTDRSSPVTTAAVGVTTWRQIDAGVWFSTAVKTDGTLWAWGQGGSGQLGTGNSSNYCSPVTTAGGGTNWIQVSAGTASTAAIKTDGTLWTWGCNGNGQLGTGNTTNRCSPVTTVAGGTNWCQVSTNGSCIAGVSEGLTAAIKTDGTLWLWGINNSGQLGTGNTTNYSSPVTTVAGGTNWCQVSIGSYAYSTAIKTDGTLWTWGCGQVRTLGDGGATDRSSPVTTAGGGTNWCQVSAGAVVVIALKTDGTLWTWGSANGGVLGTGDGNFRLTPSTTAGGGTNWCQVSGGYYTSFAVKTDGTLWTWGCNGNGQLGTGNTTNYSSPVTTVAGGTNWCQVSAGAAHAMGLTVTTY